MSGFTAGLLIIAVLVALPAVVDLARRADLRRMAVRNIARRPIESALVIAGSALGTAMIVAALMVGDTFDHSIRDIARTELGEVDSTFEFESPDELTSGYVAVAAAGIANVDGIAALRSVQLAAAGPGATDNRAVEPSIWVSAVDFEQVERFGSRPEVFGLRGLTTAPNVAEVVVNTELAAELKVGVGDTISLFAATQEFPLEVAAIVEADGLGGYSDAFVSLDLAAILDPVGTETYDHLIVSHSGTVFDSTGSSDQVIDDVLSAVAPLAGEVNDFDTKGDLLRDAEAEGQELTQIFSVVGGFSVLSGVLLLINLFVMLAEERKPNLGVLRAIGWKRGTLRRAFRSEGVIYAVVAAAIGAVLGIGVGWVIVRLTRSILTNENPDSEFELLLSVRPMSLLTAGLAGVIIAMAAIWFTSWRISRLNIISAIRDLPEPATRRSRRLVLAMAALAVALGALMLGAGLSGSNAFLSILGVPIAVIGIGLVLKRRVAPTVVTGLAGAATVVWGLLFFPMMPRAMTENVDINFFLVFGVVVVAGGVAMTTVLGPSIQRVLTRGERPMVASRLAMAFPSARLFRTAVSLAMYSLIIFSLAFMAVLSSGIAMQAGEITTSTAAGHDIMVVSNGANPITVDALAEVEGVAVVSPLLRDWAEFSADFESALDSETYDMVGIESEFAQIGSPTLKSRAERFASDQAALSAVANDPTLIIVPTWFLTDDGTGPTIGSTVTATTAHGTSTFELVGVTQNDYAWSGPWLAAEAVRVLQPEAQTRRLYVQVEPGSDSAAVASTIESRFITNGADAEPFSERVQRFVDTDLGFFSLLRGYLLLGLVIGIAGLAVSLFRAVRERRREIGMMRAMGLPDRGVRNWFLTEAIFVSLLGIVTGVGLGLVNGYFMATKSAAFDGEALPFRVPWGTLAFIVAVPFVASALAALVPARRASRLLPAEALRLAD